jgi:hypothetical protein
MNAHCITESQQKSTYNSWVEWWWNSLGEHIVPVDTLEKGMSFDFFGIISASPKPSLGVTS